MNVFAKIFAQIFDSSISADYMVRHIFMDLLVLADRDGVVDMTIDAISRRTNVPEEMVARAIAELCRPDIKSRSHEEEGCRLVPIDSHRDWGWQIVNYEHYRNIKDEEARRTYFRDKKRQQRSKPRSHGPTPSNLVKDSPIKSKEVTQGEGEGDLDIDTDPLPRGYSEAPSQKTVVPDSADTRILSESVGIFGMKEQTGMDRLLAVHVKQSKRNVADAIRHMVGRWEEYQAASPTLEWSFGSSYKFFMSGNWDKPETWPRIGAKPSARDLEWKEFNERTAANES